MSKYLDLSNYKNNLQLEREKHLAEEAVALTNKQKLSLYKKSQKSGYSTDILEEVYRRGHMIWKAELFEGTREQFAFDRVNSFISGGFAADLDSDLLDMEEAFSDKYMKQARLFAKAKKAKEKATKSPPKQMSSNEVDDLVKQYLAKGGKIKTEEFVAEKEVWDKPNPKQKAGKSEKLSPAAKAKAKARARAAGRPYPNMVDNIWAARNEEYTGAEKVSKNKNKPSSRFDATSSLADIYKGDTPGQEPMRDSTLSTIKRVISEATYKGKTVPLNKPMKGDVKKSKVYVDPDGDGKAQKVNFGDKNMTIKKNQPGRKASYCARSSGQGNLTDKTSANYWSRKAWDC